MSATGDAPAGAAAGRPGSQAGTTLIEALALVAITALVSLIGFPSLRQGLLVLEQRQTAAVIAARLRQARAEALRRDTATVFAIAPDGRAYGAPDGVMRRTPAGVSLSARGEGDGRIFFQGDGSSSGGVVRIRAARRALSVTVASPGGAVTIGPG